MTSDECQKDVTALSDLQLWLIMIRWVISIFGDQLHYSDAMMSCCCWINWATVTNNARGCLSLVVVLMNNSTTVRPKIRRQFVWYWWHAKWGICWWCTQVNASTSVSLSVSSDYSRHKVMQRMEVEWGTQLNEQISWKKTLFLLPRFGGMPIFLQNRDCFRINNADWQKFVFRSVHASLYVIVRLHKNLLVLLLLVSRWIPARWWLKRISKVFV